MLLGWFCLESQFFLCLYGYVFTVLLAVVFFSERAVLDSHLHCLDFR